MHRLQHLIRHRGGAGNGQELAPRSDDHAAS
jgi:hypothetical protein